MKKLLALIICMVMVLPLAAYAASEVSLENASITMGTNSTDSQSSVGSAWYWGLLKDGIISDDANKIRETYATYSIHPAKSESAWVIIDMGEGKTAKFSSVQVYKRLGWDNQALSKGYLYISDDGKKWAKSDLAEIDIKERYAEIPASFNKKKGTVSARFIKIEAVQVGGNDSQVHWGMEEIKLISGGGSALNPEKKEQETTKTDNTKKDNPASSSTSSANKTVKLPESSIITVETDSTNAKKEVGSSYRWNMAKDGIISTEGSTVPETFATYSISPEKNESAWTIVDMGNDMTFSGVRIYKRLGWDAQAVSKAYLYVSADGMTWMKSDLATLDIKQRYADIPASFGGTKINVKANFVKIEAVQVGGNDNQMHWGFEEIELLSPSGTTVKTPADLSAYKASEKEKVTEEVKKDTDIADDAVLSDRSKWTVSASSEMNPITYAFDGNKETFWHSNYTVKDGTVVSHDEGPFDINITLPSATLISGVTFTSRSGGNYNGLITSYEIFGSETDEGPLVLMTSGKLSGALGEETVKLFANVKVKKVQLKVNGVGGFGVMAELELVGANKKLKTQPVTNYKAFEEANRLYSVNRSDFTATDNCEVWASHEPAATLDGSTDSFWQTEASGFPYILDIDMKKAHEISEITYIPRLSNDNHGSWESVEISVSDNGESFTKVYSVNDLKINTEKKTFTLSKPVKARYWRFSVLKAFADRASCSELEFFCSKKELDRLSAESKETYILQIDSKVIKVTKGTESYEKTIDVSPFIYGASGTTLIPLRGLLEEMGSTVSWNAENETITIDQNKITMQIQDELVYVNDSHYGIVRYTLRVAPMIKDSRTFIPLRFVSEQLGYDVSWNGETREITISK